MIRFCISYVGCVWEFVLFICLGQVLIRQSLVGLKCLEVRLLLLLKYQQHVQNMSMN